MFERRVEKVAIAGTLLGCLSLFLPLWERRILNTRGLEPTVTVLYTGNPELALVLGIIFILMAYLVITNHGTWATALVIVFAAPIVFFGVGFIFTQTGIETGG